MQKISRWRVPFSVRQVRLVALGRWAALFMAALAGVGASLKALAQASFDSQPYKIDGGFNTPMNTIAGLTNWAHDINQVYGLTTWIVVVIFVAVAIPLVYTIHRFREKPGDESIPKQVEGNKNLEVIWTIIPCFLLLVIAIPTWQVIFKHAADRNQPGAMHIKVIGHQWWWEFQYPELGITTAGEVHFPENTPIFFELTSADVIHSFWIPKFGGKVDAIPGQVNTMAFVTPAATQPPVPGGDYFQGQCVELCGLSHALMRFQAVVHTKDGFQAWAKAHNEAPRVETASEKDGETVFNTKGCVACHTIAGTPSADLAIEKVGPNLSTFGSRAYFAGAIRKNTPANLALWLKNPPELKPGSLMPNLGLSDQEIASLSSYLRNSTAKTY